MATAHAKPHHEYHLVNPSPWPAVGATSAFVAAVGAIMWMHHMAAYAPLVLGAGAIGIAYTMVGWWRDVIYEAEVEGDHTRVVQISHRYGMILFIASEVMFFVAWFWAYFNTALFPDEFRDIARIAYTGGVWPPKSVDTFDPWHLPLLNTLILLTSGTTVTWAHHALLENDRKGLVWGLALTIALGLSFTCVQAWEYMHAAFHFSGNIYGATFFMATGFHGAHVIIGSIFLIVCLFRAIAGQFKPTQHLGFEFAAWYWHFVDVVWLFLFACIYVWVPAFAATIRNLNCWRDRDDYHALRRYFSRPGLRLPALRSRATVCRFLSIAAALRSLWTGLWFCRFRRWSRRIHHVPGRRDRGRRCAGDRDFISAAVLGARGVVAPADPAGHAGSTAADEGLDDRAAISSQCSGEPVRPRTQPRTPPRLRPRGPMTMEPPAAV